MIVKDVVTRAKDLSGESNTGQRWSDDRWIRAVDQAQKNLILKIKWPESRFIFNTATGVQEYQLQEVIRILRVYVNGQIVSRTEIPTLEGRQIEMDDQTGTVGGPGGAIVPGAASVLVANMYTPQWTSQAAATYPVQSSLGYPVPNQLPWFAGRRPVYYTRGGNIGFVPAPAGSYPVVCDVIAQPAPVSNITDDMILPEICKEYLACSAVEDFMFSDKDNAQSNDARNMALQRKQQALADIRDWRRDYDGSDHKAIKVLTNRSFYTKGNNRRGRC